MEELAAELAAYHAHFAPLFKRSEQRRWAEVYLRGLLTADVPRKNVEAMALRLLGAGPGAERRVRALQQFIGEGGWDDAAFLAAHQRLVDESLGADCQSSPVNAQQSAAILHSDRRPSCMTLSGPPTPPHRPRVGAPPFSSGPRDLASSPAWPCAR